MDRHLQTLFRLLPTSSAPCSIKDGVWTSITLEVVSEFGGYRNDQDPSQTFRLRQGETILPLECCLLLEADGQIVSQHSLDQSACSQGFELESRALQSTNWLGLDSLSRPGIGPTGRGGLEIRVSSKEPGMKRFWISIGAAQHEELVPLVLGPITLSSERLNVPDSKDVLRPISIPMPSSRNPQNSRIMLLKETWNSVPQGRVWDSAFVLMDIFSREVTNSLNGSLPPIFAGKHILDLSAGTGLLGIFLAGLAQVELESLYSRTTNTAPHWLTPMHNTASIKVARNPSIIPVTTIILTDLKDALPLIRVNITSNQRRIAPDVNVFEKQLMWGASHLSHLNAGELDIVIASDVVYEADSFNSLLETLYGLCTPGRTTLYLGYKRRGLDVVRERQFFDQIEARFTVEKSLQSLGVQVWCLRRETKRG
ncbi:Methyltransferase-like protein 21A [Mortierella claussenii]|nr:Methyltransferase-like protein 21A [Mortierella claussenii]